MLPDSPLYLSAENIKFYSTGIIRIPVKKLSPNLSVLVKDNRVGIMLGKGVVVDILYDTLSDEGNHIVIIEMTDGRIIKTHWAHVEEM